MNRFLITDGADHICARFDARGDRHAIDTVRDTYRPEHLTPFAKDRSVHGEVVAHFHRVPEFPFTLVKINPLTTGKQGV